MSLKKFEILEMVAKGGMAEVYRAKTVGAQGFEKEVCVKRILPHLTEDEAFVTMFVNEAKLAAKLSYANIVSVHDLCISASGDYFIVMEYVAGKDLSDLLRTAQIAGLSIPFDVTVFILRELCKGLDYAHRKHDVDGAPLGIIHRDISPHNVLVSFMGEVKITDFGIAKASSIANKTAIGILKGKYGYMSPEQARGQPLDLRSDIFNAGIVLYELLVGERCFAGSSDFSTLNLMRNAEVARPREISAAVPEGLERIALKALSKSREHRYQTALEMESALGDYARAAGFEASAPDLAKFMRTLFSRAPAGAHGPSTDVLALSSVAAPAPAPHDPAPSPAPPEKPRAAPPPPKEASRPAVVNPEPKEKEPRRPARLKGAKAPEERKPLRRDRLRPVPASPPPRGQKARWAAATLGLALIGGTVGAFIGSSRAGGLAAQTPFREGEHGRRPANEGPLRVFIETSPRGANVRFDGARLAARTPLTIERGRDSEQHTIELELKGHKTKQVRINYAAGAVTFVSETLESDRVPLRRRGRR